MLGSYGSLGFGFGKQGLELRDHIGRTDSVSVFGSKLPRCFLFFLGVLEGVESLQTIDVRIFMPKTVGCSLGMVRSLGVGFRHNLLAY